MKCKRCQKRLGFLGFSFSNSTEFCDACKTTIEKEEKLVESCYLELAKSLKGGLDADAANKILESYSYKGLAPSRLTQAKRLVYSSVVRVFSKDEVIDDNEAESLSKLKSILLLGLSDVADLDQHLELQQHIWQLKRGELPTIDIPVPLKKKEIAHFAFQPVEFHQERVVKRGYEGGSRGVSIRIAKGVTYRVGGHRGQLVSRTAIVQLDTGELFLTSQRLIFSGPQKSFSVPAAKILNTTAYGDGFSFVRDSTAASNKPFYLMYNDMDYMGTALSAWFNAVT